MKFSIKDFFSKYDQTRSKLLDIILTISSKTKSLQCS